MKRYVVVSCSNSIDYYFYAPYIEKAWNKFGWNLIVVITNDVSKDDLKLSNPETQVIRIHPMPELRDATIAQAGRLYAANYFKENEEVFLMTSDMDMLPLCDYWHPNENEITVYGHDLTWRSFYPMSYIAMSSNNWKRFMQLSGDTELDLMRDAKDETVSHSPLSNDFEQYWNFDWSLITQRMKPSEKEIKFIDRGQIDIAGATLAKGRIDRYNFEVTQNQPEPMIDAHLHNTSVLNPERHEAFLKVFNKYIGSL